MVGVEVWEGSSGGKAITREVHLVHLAEDAIEAWLMLSRLTNVKVSVDLADKNSNTHLYQEI